MNWKQLNEIEQRYRSYEGTGNNNTNKNGVAIEYFSSVLYAALSLASEVEDLKSELRSKPIKQESTKISKQDELEDQMLCDDEPCDMKQAADFARYG